MEALKISGDKSERAGLTAKCRAFLDQAEVIKSADRWPPLKPTSPSIKDSLSPPAVESRTDLVKSVAAETRPHEIINELKIGSSSSSSYDAAVDSAHNAYPIPTQSEILPMFTPPTLLGCEASPPWPSELSLLENFDSYSPTMDTCGHPFVYDSSQVAAGNHTRVPSSVQYSTASLGSSLPEHSSEHMVEVKPLSEPVSTRPLSKKEQIILLKASKINGFVCPPWKEPPDFSEFVLHDEADPFLYVLSLDFIRLSNGSRDAMELTLSSHQMDHFQTWARAKDALPPPSWFSGERQDLHPVMRASRSVDLVQDAATDCSVVASLCAGIARTERGHDSVSTLASYGTMT